MLFLGLNCRPIALFTAADDLVCHIEDFEVDRVYIGHFEAVLALKLEKSFDLPIANGFRRCIS
jgi:hypothetical protein